MKKKGLICRERYISKDKTRPRTERYAERTEKRIDFTRNAPRKEEILGLLPPTGVVAVSELNSKHPSASRVLKSLEKTGHVKLTEKRIFRSPFGEKIEPDIPPALTDEQQHVIRSVKEKIGTAFSTFLLAGVTGSGKTEVYMHLTAECIRKKLSVIVLVPEIALISQVESRFRARFGDRIAVLHSGLNNGQRFDQWCRIIDQNIPVVIGARSAIFAPCKKTGLIIVDEEHDTSFKQESSLRYNARDLAIVRAKLENATALLGSATPSVHSFYNSENKIYSRLNLKHRATASSLPEIEIIDLKKMKGHRGPGRFFSPELIDAMKSTLSRNEQVLLFINRRGFANYPVCAICGNTLTCKNCDISLTFHKSVNAYKCHFCGHTRSPLTSCDTCGGSSFKNLGMGTEKIEAAVKTLFPDNTVVRMDRDTTENKKALLNILKNLRTRSIDILIGTQMVAKGHDFPHITLVGIICADLSLNFPDFRACERTFQLLAQVAGRAGRGSSPGKVILQTYSPDHFSIQTARNQDYESFYKKEIVFRKSLSYPPFTRFTQILISGKDKKAVINHSQIVGDFCNALRLHPSFSNNIKVLGPVEASITRLAGHFRHQILIRGMNAGCLHQFVHTLKFGSPNLFNARHIKVVLDIDPFFLM